LKYLVVIALVALLLFLLYRRLRPYIKRLREILDAIRQFQKGSSTVGRRPVVEKLVQCETCGIWIPASRALASRSEKAFCSIKCREGRKWKLRDERHICRTREPHLLQVFYALLQIFRPYGTCGSIW